MSTLVKNSYGHMTCVLGVYWNLLFPCWVGSRDLHPILPSASICAFTLTVMGDWVQMINATAWVFMGSDDEWTSQIYCKDVVGLPERGGVKLQPHNRYTWHVSIHGSSVRTWAVKMSTDRPIPTPRRICCLLRL